MTGVRQWTGHEARQLRLALRRSVRDFAAYLTISYRTVGKWEAGGSDTVPAPDSQALLDTALRRADPEARARFFAALDESSPRPAGDMVEEIVAAFSSRASVPAELWDRLWSSDVCGRTAPHAPALHLRRLADGGLFEVYSESFEAVWAQAKGIG